ncbi:MAG: DUF2400 domain-containing protein [Thermoplasmata archaeon]|nr:DUF2400 domain-containing protein [Thermoplasmata archaeon]
MIDHRPTAAFPEHLRELAARFPLERSLREDPLSCVRAYRGDRRSSEIAGVFASTLAIGNTTAIRGAFARLVAMAGGDLSAWVDGLDRSAWRTSLGGFRHRWLRGDQMGYLGWRLHALYETYDSLEEPFLEGMASEGGGFAAGLDHLAHALRSQPGDRTRGPPGYDHLFPSPVDSARSPCKRLTLFVRWMARREYPDLGLWTRVSPADLRIPLDQHVYWIAYHLGLTQRKSKSWPAVEDVTESLRRIDPSDPVKYDFVLCHTGISGDCPKERDIAVCGPCSVRPDCLLWRGRRAS